MVWCSRVWRWTTISCSTAPRQSTGSAPRCALRRCRIALRPHAHPCSLAKGRITLPLPRDWALCARAGSGGLPQEWQVAGGAESVAVVEGHILVIIDPTAELEFSSAPPPPPSAPSAAETVLEDEAREKEVYIEALPRCAGGAGPQG